MKEAVLEYVAILAPRRAIAQVIIAALRKKDARIAPIGIDGGLGRVQPRPRIGANTP